MQHCYIEREITSNGQQNYSEYVHTDMYVRMHAHRYVCPWVHMHDNVATKQDFAHMPVPYEYHAVTARKFYCGSMTGCGSFAV